ncbi:hypothetical protein I316_00863 [Kwoniella heveanensis BCC8398]|uniref:Uncharacterized protein n=1 Tax=Kwoniella heveanensis BCC8398 TaxID=1296120 RepID=A0A1B9H388_9TREE|nr:hypothetical protein I316_00863 [Kwoniella heveanensis BCC8398]
MRIKIALLPPFAPNKVILPVPQEVDTISTLRKYIVKSLAVVAEHATKGRDIVLEIDGFELLGGSRVDVIEGVDVVSVRLAPGSSKQISPHTESSDAKDRTYKTCKKRRISSAPLDIQEQKRRRLSARHNTPEIKPKSSITDSKPSKSKKQLSIVKMPPAIQFSKSKATTTTATSEPKRARSLSSASVSSASSFSSSSSSPSSSTSSSSSSASPCSSSSSSSSASSSSASSDTSSSTSSSASPEKLKPTGAFPVYERPRSTCHSELQSQPHVPPGQGKTATQNRNARRRLARQYKKQAVQNAVATTATAAKQKNAVGRMSGILSEGSASPIATTAATSELPIPRSTANRNKKRGFLEDMKAKRGTKTVFASAFDQGHDRLVDIVEETTTRASQPERPQPVDIDGSFALPYIAEDSLSLSTQLQTPSSKRARITAPSEMTDLPSNVFVTSAEFSRAPTSPRRRRKNFMLSQTGSDADLTTEAKGDIDADNFVVEGAIQVEEQGLDEEMELNAEESVWDRVERDYETLPVLSPENVQRLGLGSILACKELELNMMTFSPELMLKLARVSSVDNESTFVLEKMVKPVPEGYDAEEGEGGYGEGYRHGYDASGGDEEAEAKAFTLSPEDIKGGTWRIV